MKWIALAVVIACASLLYEYWSNQPVDKGDCYELPNFPKEAYTRENLQGECYFSRDYYHATEVFMKEAALAGGKVSQLPVVDDLKTSVAVFRGNDEDYLIHISGTHGPESFAGSAAQRASIKYLRSRKLFTKKNESVPTVIFVHSLNPYGFKTFRRVNEDNIDLNRNFLTDEDFEFVRKRDPNYANYVDLDPVLNPTSMPFTSTTLNEIYSAFKVAFYAAMYGVTSLKRALVAGNCFKQTGFGCGGLKRSKSAQNLIDLVTSMNIPTTAKSVMLLDVHTGLGPAGVDTLLYGPPVEGAKLEEAFPTEYEERGKAIGGLKGGLSSSKDGKKSDGEAVASGSDLTVGLTTGNFCNDFLAPHLGGDHKICTAQEFGTVRMLTVQ